MSLPLEGRLDLMMPKPKRKVSFLSPPYPSPSAIATPIMTAPRPQTIQQQMTQSPTWDASRHSPPQHGGPEMSIPINLHYAPAWDQPLSAQSAYHSSQHIEPEYPNIPANVRSDDWYKQFTTSTPDRSNVQPLFPWEEGQHQRRPDRIFPRGESPLRQQGYHPDVFVSPHHASPSLSSPPGKTPPRSMTEAIASYTNAWDAVPSIQRYVNSISGPGLQSSKRDLDLMGLQSVPGTPGLETPSRRGMSTDRRSDASGDGDDEEDEDEEDTMETSSSPSAGHSRESTFDLPLELPMKARYRDRQAHPDRSYQETQFPGGMTGPMDRTSPERKPVARQMPSLSELPRPASYLVTRVDVAAETFQSPTPTPAPAHPESEPKTRRIWDPRTDVDVRKRDSQNVLTRFMNDGGVQGPGERRGEER